MKARSATRWLNIAFLGIGALIGATCTPASTDEYRAESQRGIQPLYAAAPQPAANGIAPSLADVAERAVPSVVNIAITRRMEAPGRVNPLLDDPMLREFFGQRGQPDLPAERQTRALGSGVIVGTDGVVLTSAHVVEGADQVEITLQDGRELSGKVVGADTRSDLAVVRIQDKVTNLVALPLGDSTTLRLGDIVLAIGNPFGVGQTVTMGIVSATGRASMGIVDYEDFIQTDAAINPGNSGGALVNMKGELVGINTAILSRTGGSMGIGFAIPSAMASPIMKSLLANGKVIRGYLGVSVQDLDRNLAEALHLGQHEGILVADIVPDTPAARAGIQRGDVLRTLAGRPIKSSAQFRNQVAALAPGTKVRLDLTRDGKPKTLELELGTLEESANQSAPGEPDDQPAGVEDQGLLGGVRLLDLRADLRRRLNIPARIQGAAVAEVQPGTPADRLGLRPGDIIMELNRHRVTSAADVRRLARTLQGSIAVLIYRDGATAYLAARD
jgi:serine protease Do